jgi:RNA polymerase sigma factor (sigma-70 family)
MKAEDAGGRVDDVLTDSELMERSIADPATFAQLFDRHHGELYRYLRRRAGPSLAADIAAETFLTAFARRDRYLSDGQSVRPWLYGIAHNLLRNHARSERRQWLAYARHGEMPDVDQAAADAFGNADSRADASAAAARIGPILANLPAADRDVLLLFAWADMSYADIASTLQIPVGTVRSRLNRARRQLRDETRGEPMNSVIGGPHG